MKIQKIIVGIDFSAASIEAARWAITMFGAEADVVLAHIIDIPEVPDFLAADVPGSDELHANAMSAARQRLDAVVARVGAEAIAGSHVGVGSMSAETAALVLREHADLVVIGEHGPGHGLWDALGTTAERLVHDLTVPVLISRATLEERPSMILAPVDESPASDAVMQWSGLLAGLFNAELVLLHVVDAQLTGRVRLVSADSASREFEERLRRSTEAWLDKRIAGAGLNPQRTLKLVAIGDPRREVLAAAERVRPDLIVVGSRAGPMSRVLVGSVARSVLRQARCSVCLLPRHVGG